MFIFTAAFASADAYEVEEQLILDNPERRVLWRLRGRADPAPVPGRAERADRYPSGRVPGRWLPAGVRVRLFACGTLGREVPVSIGPEEWAGHGRMRAGHADRERVITELKAAFVQGRLDKDELEERAGRAVVSRTYAELAALTDDIPAPASASTAARLPGRRELARPDAGEGRPSGPGSACSPRWPWRRPLSWSKTSC